MALVAERRLHNAAEGRERNEIARDSFSYLHFPMIAGIELMALGFEKTLEHVDEHLKLIPAVALMGGAAVYLLAHVAFRWRNVHRFSTQRLVAALRAARAHPGGHRTSPRSSRSCSSLVVLVAVLVYEYLRFAELRARLRARSPRHDASRRCSLRGVVKRFGALTAVDGLDLEVPDGTCVGLLGPNGAGKSTTMKALTAQVIADEGEIERARPPAARATPSRRARRWASCRSSTTSTCR